MTAAATKKTKAVRRPHPVLALAPLLVNADDAGHLLGVSGRTVRRWNQSGDLPAPDLRIGGIARWSVDELRRWVEGGCRPRLVWEKQQQGRPRRDLQPNGRLEGGSGL